MPEHEDLVGFGYQHNEFIARIEALAGGAGPFADPRFYFDAVGDPVFMPEAYHSPFVTSVRDLAIAHHAAQDPQGEKEMAAELLAARRKVFTTFDFRAALENLYLAVHRLPSGFRHESRLQQVRSLEVGVRQLTHELGFMKRAVSFRDAFSSVTGLAAHSVQGVPSRQDLLLSRQLLADTLREAGYDGASFAEQVAYFREGQERVGDAAAFRLRYAREAERFVSLAKGLFPEIPTAADVRVTIPEKITPGVGGSFDYGRGGRFQAESFVLPQDDMPLVNLVATVAHEIGGHFPLAVLWDLYSSQTGDPYGAVQTMRTNMTVVNEGVAEQGLRFYRPFLADLYGIDFVATADLSLRLSLLNRALLCSQAQRRVQKKLPSSQKNFIAECVSFGLLPQTAESRACGMYSDRSNLDFLTYTGPAYYPGLSCVSRACTSYSPEAVLRAVREPLSIHVLLERARALS